MEHARRTQVDFSEQAIALDRLGSLLVGGSDFRAFAQEARRARERRT